MTHLYTFLLETVKRSSHSFSNFFQVVGLAATKLGLESTLRPRRRPRKSEEKVECPLWSPPQDFTPQFVPERGPASPWLFERHRASQTWGSSMAGS